MKTVKSANERLKNVKFPLLELLIKKGDRDGPEGSSEPRNFFVRVGSVYAGRVE